MNRTVPQIVCALAGVIMFAVFFSSHPTARAINQTALDYWQIIFAFALIVGVIGYVKVNVRGIEQGSDRPYRTIGLLGMLVMPVFALIWGIKGSSPFMWMFENVQAPMQSTVFALLAFFVASASLRGFRARSLPAVILLLSAVIILLSRSSLESASSDALTRFADWLRNYASMAARRGILIGIGLGSLTTSLRVILGIERTWLGGRR